MENTESMKNLKQIPWIGDSMAKHLITIGINKVSDLKGRNPQELYMEICFHRGYEVNVCALYVLRLAVYFASNEILETEKLKWNYWKDGK